jgi:hypothetical protein
MHIRNIKGSLVWHHSYEPSCPKQNKINDDEDNFYEELERAFDKFNQYNMKILLWDFNAGEGKEGFSNQPFGTRV